MTLPAGNPVPGTEGYAEAAADLLARYEQIPFVEKHQAVLHLLPKAPADVLDVGAATGADAAWLAAQGYRVLAVEPVAALRDAGRARHAAAGIDWLDDSLPALRKVVETGRRFDLVMITAVWMHLDEQARRTAMPVVAARLRPGGVMTMSLRHGPIPTCRRMFEVTAQETIALALGQGLTKLCHRTMESVQPANRRAGISWSHLAFESAA